MLDWSPENVEILTSWWKEGKNASEIGARLGCSTNAALKKIGRLRVVRDLPSLPNIQTVEPPKPLRGRKIGWTTEQQAILMAGLAEGLSFSRLALRIGRSRCAVAGRIMRLKAAGILPGYIQPGIPIVRKSRARPKVLRDADSASVMRLRCAREALHALEGTRLPPITERFQEGYAGQHGRLSLPELGLGVCRFPIDQSRGPVRYCGEAVVGNSVYCADHHVRCNVGFSFKSDAIAAAKKLLGVVG